MDDRWKWTGRGTSRRQWLRHCSALAFALGGAGWSPAHAQPKKTLLVIGDSLSAEYGLTRGTGWVALLERKLAAEKLNVTVVNASISGETTSGGASRTAALLREHRPTHVLLELGGNDALRGLPLEMTRANLARMAQAAKAAGAKVLIAGMQMPPNYGKRYAEEFTAIFTSVARAEGAALVPFLLAGIADGAQPLALFQADRIHPNEKAQPLMLDNVWPVLAPWLR